MFALPYASVAVPAATSTVTVPSADGVIVAVYVVPLPDSDADPPDTVMSLATKLDVLSEKVMVTANVDPVAGSDELLVIATVGDVSSCVHANWVAAVLVLPAASVKPPAATSIVVAPSAVGVNVAV